MKWAKLLGATLAYLFVLVVIYFIHVNYFNVDVVFYSALADVLFAVTSVAVICMMTNYFIEFSALEKVQLFVIWCLIGYALAMTVPTVIDRSLSFYILEKLQQRGGAIKSTAFNDIFTKEYVFEHRLMDVRLTEQLVSGSIEIENGCVRLTQRGEWLATISRAFRRNWLPKRRLLLGEYTDSLVDPFSDSKQIYDYICK